MNIIAVNGGPRKNRNTYTLLKKAMDGAESKGASVELINLYDLDYKGCISCLQCKKKGGESVGRCAVNDMLKIVLDKIHTCDGLIIGSPIYFGEVTGETRSFMERLLFQYLSYEKERVHQFGRKINTALVYTMNCPEEMLENVGYIDKFKHNETLFTNIFGNAKSLICTETRQVDDYSLFNMSMFDVSARIKRNEEVFPLDCEKAFELGAEIASV